MHALNKERKLKRLTETQSVIRTAMTDGCFNEEFCQSDITIDRFISLRPTNCIPNAGLPVIQ